MNKIDKKIRLGIVGCGRVAEERHLPALKRFGEIEIIAAADTDPLRLSRFVNKYGIKNSFMDYRLLIERNDIDAVCVLTPTASHAEIGLEALKAEKHLLIEKPLAMTIEECDQLIAIAETKTSKIVVGFNLRWHRLVRRARRLIQEGALGRIKAVRSVYTHYRNGKDAPEWHRKLKKGGGVSFNEAVHHFDLWRYLLNCEIEKIFSFNRASDYYEDETHVCSVLLSGGILGSGVYSFSTSPNSEVEIYGDAGRLYLSCYRIDGLDFFSSFTYPGDIRNRLKNTLYGMKDGMAILSSMRMGGDFSATFHGLWRHFIECIKEDKTSECTLKDGKFALSAAIGAMKSIQTGLPKSVSSS